MVGNITVGGNGKLLVNQVALDLKNMGYTPGIILRVQGTFGTNKLTLIN
ncbi:MAG: hypothetical protein CM15mP12_0930 [Gammaproteobacteria bacterium]|nr:MAG: hypothetical protein CM15mP12_0930 [Gammaproteobacteria bacterium]